MTDGILLAEIQRDRMLRRYDTLIVDEAHERSLNIDFILGYLRQLLPQRPDLSVVVTSATIDTARFASHFATDGVDAPVIEVTGRTFPGRGPLPAVRRRSGDDDQVQAIVDAVAELEREGPGDVLVFLSGEREIHDTADALRRLERPGTSRCCRCTPGCRRPSSTASSSRTAAGASCSARTSPRRRSPCPACASSSTPAPPGSPATAAGSRSSGCRSSRCPRRRPTSAPAGAAVSPRDRASACTARTTSPPGRSSPSRRSCAPTSPRSSCR